jgi:hypothetical protein
MCQPPPILFGFCFPIAVGDFPMSYAEWWGLPSSYGLIIGLTLRSWLIIMLNFSSWLRLPKFTPLLSSLGNWDPVSKADGREKPHTGPENLRQLASSSQDMIGHQAILKRTSDNTVEMLKSSPRSKYPESTSHCHVKQALVMSHFGDLFHITKTSICWRGNIGEEISPIFGWCSISPTSIWIEKNLWVTNPGTGSCSHQNNCFCWMYDPPFVYI